MTWAPATILGGLPVWADVHWGKDADTPNGAGDYWAEVEDICWRKRDGSRGKSITQKVWERAENYDCYFCHTIEEVEDYLDHQTREREGEAPSREKVSLL